MRKLFGTRDHTRDHADSDTGRRQTTRRAARRAAGDSQAVTVTAAFAILALVSAWVMLLAVVNQTVVVGLLAALGVGRFGLKARDVWRTSTADPERPLPGSWRWQLLGCAAAVVAMVWLLAWARA